MARREHSRYELEQKLAGRELEPVEIATALDALAQAGYQDDQRFAEAYVRYRGRSGFGPRRVAQELQQRGVDQALARQALTTQELDWFELAGDVQHKKFRGAPTSFAERARQTRFLQYRGFDGEHIRYALENAAGDENN